MTGHLLAALAAIAGMPFPSAAVSAQEPVRPRPTFEAAAGPFDPAAHLDIRNVILLIGDGAGAGYWSAARVRAGRLNVERMPFTGLTDTRSADSYVTDSAAGATAYATGRRTYNGGIGVGERCAEQFAADSAAVLRDPASCDPVESLFDIAHRAGVATGLVATSSITDATPAAFGAKVPHRDHVAEIAAQLAASPIDVLLGGGKFFFDGRLPENGRDLWTPLCENARCLTVPDELRSYRADDLRLVGLFADFDLEPAAERQLRLSEMTRAALDRLSRSPAGFFLVVEASQPDWRGESNEPLSEVIAEMLDFDEAIGVALDFGEAAAGTLVLVVADHDAGGLALQTHADTLVAAYTTTGHTGTMTPHFAWGPRADRFSGIRDNDEIGRMLLDIARQRERELRPTGGDHVADQVTIYRDAYGVPHVHGETDAAAVFGYLYAQAEDAFDAVEREVARMTGRLAEIDGEAALYTDLYIRALETERLSREEYERASPFFRAMADAWAAGLNHYLDRHPEVTPRVIQRFEPWQMFAVAGRSEMFGAPLVHGVLRTSEVAGALDGLEPGRGSNMWMIGPQKSATGRAMIFINPHNEPETYLEGHLLSDEGLNVYGGNRPGRPLPVFGHTPRHGWTMTNNGPDVADLWRETFDDPTNPLAYRYGDDYRVAEEWSETVRVRTDSGPVAREVTFRKTHHGPIVAVRDGVPLALRIARWEEGGTVQQFHAMARARSFEEFRTAVAQLREIWLSIGYADADGNIWYVHNGAVPRRSPEFDWSAPVDGSDPRTEWQGYHDLDELPQVLNPASGWLMNTNHSPFRVTAEEENPDPADYPPYMVQPHFGLGPTLAVLFDSLGDNARSRASRRILSGQDRFTFEEWAEAAMSKRAWEADADLPALVATWERLRETDPTRAARLGPAVETLRNWDRVSRHESVAMTLYTLLKMRQLYSWIASLEDPPFTPPAAMEIEPLPLDGWDDMDGLEGVIALLERDWGTWRVPYGELSRLQRSPDGRYTDENPSVPVLGGFPEAGMIQLFIPFPVEGQKRWYGFVSGNSYVSVVEFGASVRARSVNGSGQSTDPASPHYTDQAELYGHGGFKPAWTTLEDVRANAVRAYRPGAEREGGRQ